MRALVFWFVALATLSGRLLGQPTVTRVPTTGTSASVTDNDSDGEWEISIATTRADVPTSFTVNGTSTTDIEWIRLTAAVPQTVTLRVFGSSSGQPVRTVGSISDVTSTRQATFILGDILTTGDIGSILVNTITSGSVGGNVTGNIQTATSPNGGDITFLEVAGEIQGTGSIDVQRDLIQLLCHSKIGAPLDQIDIDVGNSIQRLQCAELHANIDLPSAKSVHEIYVTGGGSFSGDFTGSLDAGFLTSLVGISDPRIEVAGNLKATITLSGTQGLQRPLIVHGNYGGSQTLTSAGGTSAGGTIIIDGSCDSTLSLTGTANAPISIGQDVRKPITISGNLNADLTIGTDLENALSISGDLVAGKNIVVGAGTSSAGDVSLGSSGLKGQIVISAANGGALWLGDVTVGSTTLATAPYYSNLPSALGGGAVGLARYRIHDAACDPDHNGSVDLGQTTLTDVKVEFYGPVDNVDADAPVDIYIKNNFQPEGNWIEVTDDFDISVSGRVVTVTPKTGEAWLSWRVYRIRPVAGELKCLLVSGTPDVASDEYILYTLESANPPP